jgi:hypothetical protein
MSQQLPNIIYAIGSLCFLVGTLINIVRGLQ